jgi:hypothetical protein
MLSGQVVAQSDQLEKIGGLTPPEPELPRPLHKSTAIRKRG